MGVFPNDEALFAELHQPAADGEPPGVAGESLEHVDHRLQRVVLGRILVGLGRRNVFILAVPIPVCKRIGLDPGENLVFDFAPLRIAGLRLEFREKLQQIARHQRILADGLAGRQLHLERPAAVGTAHPQIRLGDVFGRFEIDLVAGLLGEGEKGVGDLGRIKQHHLAAVLNGADRLVAAHVRLFVGAVGCGIELERLASVGRRPPRERRVVRLELRQQELRRRAGVLERRFAVHGVVSHPIEQKHDVRGVRL